MRPTPFDYRWLRPAPMRLVSALVALGTTARAGSNDLAAQGTDTTAPPHRRHHAIAYDPAAKRVVIYGGQHLVSNAEAPMLDDLWSWDGRRWAQLAASTGIPMIAHQLFADGEGGLVARGTPRGLTTRWDGGRWAILSEEPGSRREMSAGAYDTRRHRFTLFGGHVDGRSFPSDTWEFDGHGWSQVTTTGPPPRLGGVMAYDPKRGVSVLFGGIDPDGRKLGDTWEWNGAHWTPAASGGPSARFGSGMAYDVIRAETVLFGGVDSTDRKLNDTWRWDGATWRQANPREAPPPRSEGYLAYDETRGVIVMFGGEGIQVVPTLGDTWEWNGVGWTRVR